MKSPRLVSLLVCAAAARLAAASEIVPLSAVINIRDADYEHARPTLDSSSQPLAIAGHAYEKGVGTQADNRSAVELRGATRFTAPPVFPGLGGIDDAPEPTEAVRLEILLDGQSAWRREMKKGEPAAAIDLD